MLLSNRAQVAEQNDSYRKGLVLGLTMAEIAILIIFILLLALAALLEIERNKLDLAEMQLMAAEKKILKYEEEMKIIHEFYGEKDLKELVRELVVAREEIKSLSKIQSKFTEAKKVIRNLEEKDKKYQEIAKKYNFNLSPEKLEQVLLEASEINNFMSKLGGDSVVKIAQDNIELHTENNRLEGQLANAQKKLETLGKGSEMPSCWAKQDGTVEYIYEISVTNKGMVIRDNELPHRIVDRKLLPVSMVVQNEEVSPDKFISSTLPLYNWSVDKKCRFYVKVYDSTGPSEKDIYKQRLMVVVGHFYRDFKIHTDF